MKQRKYLDIIQRAFRILVFPVLLAQIFTGKTGYVYLCVLTLCLMELPGLAERRLGVRLPGAMEVLLLLFLFSSEILGEIRACYVRFPCWDLLLHGFSGFLFAAIGYAIQRVSDRWETGTGFRLISAVCFSVTVGVAWEFLEWGVDMLFGLDMQKDTVITALHSVSLSSGKGNAVTIIQDIRETVLVLADGTTRQMAGYLDVGLHDTMGDLLADLAGAVVFAVLSRGEKFATHFIPIIVSKEER